MKPTKRERTFRLLFPEISEHTVVQSALGMTVIVGQMIVNGFPFYPWELRADVRRAPRVAYSTETMTQAYILLGSVSTVNYMR